MLNVRSITLEITNRCNLECIHCFNSCGPDVAPIDMAPETVRAIVDDLAAINQHSLDEAWVTGGEPLLHPRFAEIIGLLAQREQGVIVGTNGILDAEQLNLLADNASYLRRVHVSLEGLAAATDAIRGRGVFDRVTQRTIPFLRNAGIRVCVVVHLRKSNQHEIPDVVTLIIDHLDCDLKLGVLRPVGRAQHGLQHEMLTAPELQACITQVETIKLRYPFRRIWHDWDIHSQDKKFYTQEYHDKYCCPAGRGEVILYSPSADVYPCAQLRSRFFLLGNFLRQQTVRAMFESSAYDHIRRLLQTKDARCHSCSYFGKTCRGGCPAVAYGQMNTPESLCKMDPYCFVALNTRQGP